MIIAIDGPAGTGKGTISKLIAERLGFLYIDTGAMYRAITLKMIRSQIEIGEEEKIKELLENTKIDLRLERFMGKEVQKIYLDHEDVTNEIRLPEINERVSPYSAIKMIREKLVEWQRELATGKDVVMEGRDITTVVFPNAEVKIYLTASLEERAKRRWKELQAKGIDVTYEETLKSIHQRDYNDEHKEMGALKIAEDAIVVDTTTLSIEEVYEKLKDIIRNKSRKDEGETWDYQEQL